MFNISLILLNKKIIEKLFSQNIFPIHMTNPMQIIYKTPTWLTILLGCLLLIWQTYNGSISQEIQIFFFVSLIFLTGIPHGALDHLIQKATDNQQQRPYRFAEFMIKYVVIMVVYGLLWYFFSGLSFVVFICISAWHFGETDLENVPPNARIWAFTRLIYGFYVLAFILLTHATEASEIIQRMVEPQGKIMQIWNFIHQNVKQILYLLGLSLSTIFIVAQSEYFVKFDKIRVLRLILILLLSVKLPLLPAFALYFGGWHALCAFDTIHDYLRKDYPALTFKAVYLKALPFTILAFVFLGIFYWVSQYFTHLYSPFPILFIFISLITLPHLLIANQMNSRAK
jgi:beta-carotene 15,15'-dioxygenase